MDMTLLGLDYFTGHPLHELPAITCIESIRDRIHSVVAESGDRKYMYYRPESIIKSSVGEFYDDNMAFFLDTIRMLDKPVQDIIAGEDTQYARSAVLSALLPLGVLTQSVPEEWCIYDNLQETYLQAGLYHPLPEIRTMIKQRCVVQDSKFHAQRVSSMEKIAHALCAGYTPQEVGDVTRLVQDSGFTSEYIIANFLYPWVTQPMSQLRMLVPSLHPDTIQAIMDTCFRRDHRSTKLSTGLDVGYTHSYDILSDFYTYSLFKNLKLEHPFSFQHQFKTPYMMFDLPAVFTQLTDDQKKRVDECVQRSKRLYVEILKTGLRYEAQYAVLGGYRGRFCISGNLASLVEVVDTLAPPDVSPASVVKTRRIVDYIKKDVLTTMWVAEEGRLFD